MWQIYNFWKINSLNTYCLIDKISSLEVHLLCELCNVTVIIHSFQRGNLEKIFIVFMVKDSDTECTTRDNSINPFSQGDNKKLESFNSTPKRSSCLIDGDGKGIVLIIFVICFFFVCLFV